MTLARGTNRLESERLVAAARREYARDVLGLSHTVSAILPSNARSRRVAERGGARLDGHMYTLAGAGRYIEDMEKNSGPMTDEEREKIRARYHWAVVGPNPL